MWRGENFRKIAKILVFAFLCSEMQSSHTQTQVSENRIFEYPTAMNGTQAMEEHAKHQASIRLVDMDQTFGEGHICGGAIIAPSVVLTVAQCIYNYNKHLPRHPSELKVVMGTLNRYQRTDQTLVYDVTHVYQPHTFDAKTLRDNIAILMLARDIPAQHPTVEPITLNRALLQGGVKAHAGKVTSWGVTEQQVPFTHLMALNVTGLSDQMCKQSYGSLFGVGMHCLRLADANLMACPADVGAPLVHKNHLLGLSSYGNGCSMKAHPHVYTDVAYHAQWILEKIGNGRNQNSSIWGTLMFLLFTMWTFRRTKFWRM